MNPVAVATYGAPARALLIRARALIERPECWLHEPGAQDRFGVCVWPRDPAACRWDILGALERAWEADTDGLPYDEPVYIVAKGVLTEMFREHPGPDWKTPLAAYNDHPSTTHADVLALFDRAIEYLDRAAS
jgi:hypothetical protein